MFCYRKLFFGIIISSLASLFVLPLNVYGYLKVAEMFVDPQDVDYFDWEVYPMDETEFENKYYPEYVIEYMTLDKVYFEHIQTTFSSVGNYFGYDNIITGETVLEPVHDVILQFSRYGFCGASKDGKWGLYDVSGSLVIPFEYDEMYYDVDCKYITVGKNGKEGIVDATNEVVIDFAYDILQAPYEGMIAFSNNSKWGFLDLKGDVIIPAEYDGVTGFSDGLAIAKIDDNVFYLDKDNNRYYENKLQPS